MAITILNPILGPTKSAGGLATRPASLNGLRVGFLWNNRQGGEKILALVEERLNAKYGFSATVHKTKHYIGEPASKEIHDELARSVDVVITALGD